MNRRTLLSLAGLAGLAVLVWFVVHNNDPEPRPGPAEPAGSAKEVAQPSEGVPVAKTPVESPARPVPLKKVVLEKGAATPGMVRINADQVLGDVNGVPITLKDLVPLSGEKAGTDQVLSAEHFEFLLNRAVDREVTFQAARKLGVELSAEQTARLAEHKANRFNPGEAVFDTLQHGTGNVDFQQRDLAAMALQYSLAEKAGVPSPHVTTEAVAAYYQKHNSEYHALPSDPVEYQAAWATIDQDIRSKLTPELQARHEEAFKKFLEQLRASAQITSATIEK